MGKVRKNLGKSFQAGKCLENGLGKRQQNRNLERW
jgi:hypothetical protein